jgi:hypothetical protein
VEQVEIRAAAWGSVRVLVSAPEGGSGTFDSLQDAESDLQIKATRFDLRGDSSATATLKAPNGTALQTITLKAQNQLSWNNNTSHTVATGLTPPLARSAIGHIVITLTSHNGFGEGNDNWNIQSTVIILLNSGGSRSELVNSSGNPLARLTGSWPSVTLTPEASAPPGSFHQIQFVIGTGADDLRGDSSATATPQAPKGATLQQD